MRLYRVLLARERALLLGWAAGLFAFFLAVGLSYAAVRDHPRGVERVWDELPPSVRDAFGSVEDVTSPGGYYKARAASLLPLVLGGALAAQATRRLSGAEQAGELDHVLSLPVRRSQYLLAHWAVGATHAVAWLAAAGVAGIGGMALAGLEAAEVPRLAAMAVEVLPFALAAQAGALWAGAALHRRAPGAAILASALAAAYLIQVVSGLDGSLEWLSWLSPYARWARGEVSPYRPDLGYLLWCAGLVALCVPMAFRAWRRKDLTG